MRSLRTIESRAASSATRSNTAPFDSGINFLELLGLSGGMPTLESVGKDRLPEALAKLGVMKAEIDALR